MNAQTQNLTTHCTPFQLQEYLDNELSQAESVIVDRHVTMCSACCLELEMQSRLFSNINVMIEDSFRVPANFAEIVSANAEKQFRRFHSAHEQMTAMIVVTAILSLFAIFYFFDVAELLSITARTAAAWKVF